MADESLYGKWRRENLPPGTPASRIAGEDEGLTNVDREFAAHHDLPETQTCDRCHEKAADGVGGIAGSRSGVLRFCDDVGLEVQRREVQRREALEPNFMDTIGEWIPEGRVLAQRVIFLCGDCATEVGLEPDGWVVEPGYEEAFRKSHGIQDEGGES